MSVVEARPVGPSGTCPVGQGRGAAPRAAAAVHRLGPLESLRLLHGLTRPTRVETLADVVRRHPQGALLRTPLGRMLVTATASATKHVLVTGHARYRKGLGQAEARELLGDGLLTAEGGTWRDQRRDVTPYLAARAVHARQGRILELARDSADTVVRDGWDATDPAELLAGYTLGCLATTFDLPVPSAHRIHAAFDVVQDEAILRSVTQGLVPLRTRPRHAARVEEALASLGRETARALAADPAREDAWATHEGLASLFLAGYETTASTLSWAVVHLAERPDLQERIRAEAAVVDDVLAGRADASGLTGLRWAEATFRETLRTHPPVWLISRRLVEPDTVDGVALRPGDEVLILPAVAGDPDAEPFSPQRHLDRGRETSLAFGAGPRACPGGALAVSEAVLWLAVVCRRLRLRRRPGVPVSPHARMSQIPGRDLRDLVDVRPISSPPATGGLEP